MERGELLETFAVFACYIGFNPARQLIEAHGGSLEILSEPGQGTSAIVELP